MGYIVAAVNKKGEDASDTLLKMLRAVSPGEALSFGVADYRGSEYLRAPDYTSQMGPVLIASKNIYPDRYPPMPLHQEDCAVVFNGLLLDTEKPDTLSAADTIRGAPAKGIENLISRRTGAYAIAVATKNCIIAGLDHVGTIPLYYGENSDYGALASNKKALWAIGINPNPVKPGQMIKITEAAITQTQIKTIKKPHPAIESPSDLHDILKNAVEEYAAKTPRATVAFSGGIDSLLTAYYLKLSGVKIELIWTGLEDQREAVTAQEAADHLGLRIHVDTHTFEDVEANLDTVLTSVEEPDPLKISIAYPFYWVSAKTRRLGYTVMYSGNGADEAFGGYMRYLEKYLSGEDPSKDMYRDVVNSYLQNYHRDTKTCQDQGIQLLLPFTHPRLIDYALGLPLSAKLPKIRGEPRKKILRDLAKKQGISENLADRPKKAAQYSSGVNKTLLKIAKKHGMSLRDYTRKRFEEIKKTNRWLSCL